jgi:hypothetical protein
MYLIEHVTKCKTERRTWMDSLELCSGWGPVSGCCEYVNETLSSIKMIIS